MIRRVVAYAIVIFAPVGMYFIGHSSGQKQGYAAGHHAALYTRPVPDTLEMVCAGIWVGEQNKKYQEKNK